jgi:alpha,alpha-trehalase
MSNFDSGMQWDEPFGWAPTNWIAVAGLEAMGFRDEARRIASHFDATIDAGYARDGTIVEKYNVVAGNSDVHVSTGYKANQIGFGWSNAVYLKMKETIGAPPATAAH